MTSLRHLSRSAGTLTRVGLVLGGFALLPLTPATGQNTTAPPSAALPSAAPPAPTLPTISVTLQAKKTSLANAMQDLAARYHLNYVMCEAPQPEVKADFALEHRTLKDSLDTLCKPFDFQWHMGPGGVLLLEGKYTDLDNFPPLTRGEFWAVLQDFQEIARPFHVAKGDAIPKTQYRLTDSLTLAQWKTLREQGPMGGLGYGELTRDQQNDLIAYVTSREFDFFVVDLEKAVYLQSLTVAANTLQVLVVPPGAPDPQTGRVRDTAWITTRYTWRGEVLYGIGCHPNSPDAQSRAVNLPAYPPTEPTTIPATPIEHTPPLPPAQVHLLAVNTSLRALTAKLAEQTGQKVETDDAIANVRVSLHLDDVALETALDAIARPHDWRFFKLENGTWRIARKRPGAVPNVKGVAAAMMQCLPPAVRRYMRLDNVPAGITPDTLAFLKRSNSYNWKLNRAAESAMRRLYASNLPQYGKDNVVLWNALPHAAQTDLLGFRLYEILADMSVLTKGMPGYVTDPTTDVIRFANDRMDLLNLEICGRNFDGQLNSGISLNNQLSPQKLAELKANGLLTDKP